MAHGGKRQGAGRPKGSATRKNQEMVAKAHDEGITPLEYMLQVLRDESADPVERRWAAEKAAPYMHARLNSVDHKSTDGTMTPQPSHILIEAATDDDSDDQAASEAGQALR